MIVLSLILIFSAFFSFHSCRGVEKALQMRPPDCHKEFVFNTQTGKIEYLVFDKRCIRKFLLIGSTKISCKYSPYQLRGAYSVEEYGCIKGAGLLSARKKRQDKQDKQDRQDKQDKQGKQEVSSGGCGKKVAGMKCIPGGFFIRGSNRHSYDERPEQKVYVDTFYMDTYEVTNSHYKKCLQAGFCRKCLQTKKCGQLGPNYDWRYRGPNQPVVGVSWYGAQEYCQFVGKRLPTEAEWEKAARGSDGNLYPWGNEKATCEHAVIEEHGHKGCSPEIIYPAKYMPTRDVGTKPPGVYGLYDMAGNSWEWVQDWYSSSYRRCGKACRGRNPKGPCAGKEPCPGYSRKVLRGGSWWWNAYYARGSKRRAHIPQNYPEFHHFGFRCAKDANEKTD